MKHLPRYFYGLVIAVALLAAACGQNHGTESGAAADEVAEPDMVTLVDLGSLHCKPCLMMMPVLDALKKEYSGRAAVKFINVDKSPKIARKLGIMTIPTQIIYDRQGKEVLRHVGFYPKADLERQLDRLLAAQ